MINAAAYHSGKFLQETELLDSSQYCPWCDFAGTRTRVLSLQQHPDVYLLECPRCHAVSSSSVATDTALVEYYRTYYSEDKDVRVTCGSSLRLAAHICRHASVSIGSNSISVLDFGGGDGSIAYAIALELSRHSNAPIDILVIDHNNRVVIPAHPRITLSPAATLQQVEPGRQFDLILASAVLEHLPQPAKVTRQLLNMLSSGGYFYARTPYVVPLLRLLDLMHLSYDFTFPGHFHDLGQEFWENIVPTLGMDTRQWKVVRSRPSIVETSLQDNIPRTLISYCLKAPWWLMRRLYPYTGGWEVFVRRTQLR